LFFGLENLCWNIPEAAPLQYPPWSLFTFTFNFDLADGRHAALPGLSILWSIAVEEQFYLLAPLMYLVIRSRYRLAFCAAVFALANLTRALYIAYAAPKPGGGIYYMTYAYADTFVAGAMLAYWYVERSSLRARLPFSSTLCWSAAIAAVLLFAVTTRVWGTSI